EEGQPLALRGSGPSAAEAWRKMSLWGSQVDLADELKKGLSLSRSSVEGEDELLADDDVISLTSSDPAASALLGLTQEEQEMSEGEEAEAEPSVISCPAYDVTSRAYAAAGQAVGALHTMAVLQAYQADLLKDLDTGQGLSPDEVAELRCTTDLALRATKQAATAMGRSMGAMVVTERHLWVNLADLGKKERGFLLDAPVSPSKLFGASVETVVEKFRESRARSAAFKTFVPRRSRSEPEQQGGPGPQVQKTSVATRALPPPTGGSRRRRGSRG
ncbi:hypothetical protein M9458_008545, partial [Cirrhinus mrigala]